MPGSTRKFRSRTPGERGCDRSARRAARSPARSHRRRAPRVRCAGPPRPRAAGRRVPHGDVEVAREHERNLRRAAWRASAASCAFRRRMYSAPIGDIGWARTSSTSPPGALSVAAIAGEMSRRVAAACARLRAAAAVQREPDVMFVRHFVVVRVALAQPLELSQPSPLTSTRPTTSGRSRSTSRRSRSCSRLA